MTVFSMSRVFSIQPTPRTMYSALFFWIDAGRRPAELLLATAAYSSPSVTP